jgi:hypothetical protein
MAGRGFGAGARPSFCEGPLPGVLVRVVHV